MKNQRFFTFYLSSIASIACDMHGDYNENTIRVYQAYNEAIAREVVQKGTFGSQFKMERMTWIKPSFLWMMYRCGWGTKENQEHILAIDINRDAFDYIVNNAVMSSYNEVTDMSHEQWQERVKHSDIRCQWDPEKDIWGNSMAHRSIQLGLRGKSVYAYVNEWIVHIEDITDYVTDLYVRRNRGEDISRLLPKEETYIVNKI